MVKLKLLKDQIWYNSTIEEILDRNGNKLGEKRRSHPVKGHAGQLRDFSSADAEKMIVAQSAMPIDANGDITEAALKLLGRHEKEDAYNNVMFNLSEVERERLGNFYVAPVKGTPVLDSLMGKAAPSQTVDVAAVIAEHAPKDAEEAAANLKAITDKVANKTDAHGKEIVPTHPPVKPRRRRRTNAELGK